MSRRTPIPRSRRGRLKPTLILRVNFRASRAFNRCLAQTIIADIKGGKTRWPVDTGLSRRSFYYRRLSSGGFQLYNRAGYAGYVEARGRFIERYWRQSRGSIIRRCEREVPQRDKLTSRQKRQKGRIRSYVKGLAAFRAGWGRKKDESDG